MNPNAYKQTEEDIKSEFSLVNVVKRTKNKKGGGDPVTEIQDMYTPAGEAKLSRYDTIAVKGDPHDSPACEHP